MLKLFISLVVSLSLLKSSLLVEAFVICPPPETISPFDCTEFGTSNTTSLDCYYKELTDSQVSDILDAYLATPNVSPVGQLRMGSNTLLTRIPVQMKSFTQLVVAAITVNPITSIESGAFNFADDTNPLKTLSFSSDQVTTIEPGAFKGFHFIFFYPF